MQSTITHAASSGLAGNLARDLGAICLRMDIEDLHRRPGAPDDATATAYLHAQADIAAIRSGLAGAMQRRPGEAAVLDAAVKRAGDAP